MTRYGHEARNIVSQAHGLALARGADRVEVEHMLGALVNVAPNSDAARCLEGVGLTPEVLGKGADAPVLSAGNHLPLDRFARIAMQLASTVARAYRHPEITPTHIAWGVVQAANDRVSQLIVQPDVDVDDLRDRLYQILDAPGQ